MAKKMYPCDECSKRRVNVTVVGGRDLCPACLPPLRPSTTTDRTFDPSHRDPLIRRA